MCLGWCIYCIKKDTLKELHFCIEKMQERYIFQTLLQSAFLAWLLCSTEKERKRLMNFWKLYKKLFDI